MPTDDLWRFLPFGYALTVLVEAPVLWFGLSSRFTRSERLIAGFWLTAVTYPIVILVLPLTVMPRYGYGAYLAVAETFAPAAECGLFWLAYRERAPIDRVWFREWGVIVLANLLSFAAGFLLD